MREFVRCLGCDLAIAGKKLSCPGKGMDNQAGQDHGADRVQAKFERGHDAEIAATSALCPEQVGVLGCARLHELAVSHYHVD